MSLSCAPTGAVLRQSRHDRESILAEPPVALLKALGGFTAGSAMVCHKHTSPAPGCSRAAHLSLVSMTAKQSVGHKLHKATGDMCCDRELEAQANLSHAKCLWLIGKWLGLLGLGHQPQTTLASTSMLTWQLSLHAPSSSASMHPEPTPACKQLHTWQVPQQLEHGPR